MPAKEQREQRNDLERHARETLHSFIGEQVIHALGEPRDLLQVQVRPLWENHYRANVFTGKDAGSARMADSYSLTADGDGNIVASTPEIVKKY